MDENCVQVRISGRRFQIRLEGFENEAKKEIFEIFDDREIHVEELLEFHLSKIQEYWALNERLKGLLDKIPQ